MTRPGLAKARLMPLMLTRRGLLVRTTEPPWRKLFDTADVVSEGLARDESGGRVWYGSTSLILRASAGGDDGDADAGADEDAGAAGAASPVGGPTAREAGALLASLAAHNVHVRLRAIRTAVREASLRAPGRLGRCTCELHFQPSSEGVRIDVDVQAPLIERRARARPAQ